MRILQGSLCCALLIAAPAQALPPVQIQANMSDETRVELRLLGQAIHEDAVSWCQITVRVTGDVDPLTAGDVISLEVYEDDAPLFDDLLWETQLSVSAIEAAASRAERTLDCATSFGGDLGNFFEIYAVATVDKSASGAEEQAETDLLDVQIVEDDAFEEDDGAVRSTDLLSAGAQGRIARDGDWFTFTLDALAAVSVTVQHLAAAGRVDVVLLDQGQQTLNVGGDADDAALVEAPSLDPGVYYLVVSPRLADDFAFYDLRYDYVPFSCVPDALESRPCGLCGAETRVCSATGRWGAWSMCADEGECVPGAVEISQCVGGTAMRTCADLCTWGDLGPCVPDPLGAPCASDAQCGNMICLDSDGLFAGGYCSHSPCASDDICGPTGACLPAFGGSFCLLECPDGVGCRLSYLCAEVEGLQVCLPRCLEHADCGAADAPRCDPASGLCAAPLVPDAGSDAADASAAHPEAGAADAAGTDSVAEAGTADTFSGADAASPDVPLWTDGPEGIIGDGGGGCVCGTALPGSGRGPLTAVLLLLLWCRRERGRN